MTQVTLTADMPIRESGEFALEQRRAQSRGRRLVQVESLPRGMFCDAHERQCHVNHSGQSLERLRERHGISAREALAILTVVPFEDFREVTEQTAMKALYEWVATYRRGALGARVAP